MTDLATKQNTVSSIYVDWMAEKTGPGSSKYEQLAKISMFYANKAVISDLKQFEGKGISSAQILKQAEKLNKCKKPADGLFVLAQATLSGAGLSAKI